MLVRLLSKIFPSEAICSLILEPVILVDNVSMLFTTESTPRVVAAFILSNEPFQVAPASLAALEILGKLSVPSLKTLSSTSKKSSALILPSLKAFMTSSVD